MWSLNIFYGISDCETKGVVYLVLNLWILS